MSDQNSMNTTTLDDEVARLQQEADDAAQRLRAAKDKQTWLKRNVNTVNARILAEIASTEQSRGYVDELRRKHEEAAWVEHRREVAQVNDASNHTQGEGSSEHSLD